MLPVDDNYLKLVQQFPLRPLRSDADLDSAIGMIDSLIDRELTSSEHDYMIVLSLIIECYEDKHYSIPPISGVKTLEHLIKANNLTQSKIAADTNISESTLSEILAGKRRLNIKHIKKLGSYFHVSPTLFIMK